MDEKKEVEEGRGLGTLFIVATIVVVLVVGFGIYNYISEPFHTADSLKDRINDLGNVTSDYRQGWLDCADYYLWLKTAPTNVTSSEG